MHRLDRCCAVTALLAFVNRISATEAEPRLLLHLDFEADQPIHIIEGKGKFARISTGMFHVPGRIGKYGVNAAVNGYFSVAAAGTDLELEGTPYTVTCWVLADAPEVFTNAPEVIRSKELHALIPLAIPESILDFGD